MTVSLQKASRSRKPAGRASRTPTPSTKKAPPPVQKRTITPEELKALKEAMDEFEQERGDWSKCR